MKYFCVFVQTLNEHKHKNQNERTMSFKYIVEWRIKVHKPIHDAPHSKFIGISFVFLSPITKICVWIQFKQRILIKNMKKKWICEGELRLNDKSKWRPCGINDNSCVGKREKRERRCSIRLPKSSIPLYGWFISESVIADTFFLINFSRFFSTTPQIVQLFPPPTTQNM